MRGLILALVLVGWSQQAYAWKSTEARIAMRDGVKLETRIYAPEGVKAAPILLLRTPYELPDPGDPSLAAVASGNILVFQRLRGTGASEGQFILGRPLRDRADKSTIDEATDAWDTIDWLVGHVKGNNGRVGMLGSGYAGWTQLVALTEPHPALKAIAPEGPTADLYDGELFRGGAFRLGSAIEALVALEGKRAKVSLVIKAADRFAWFLELGGLARIDRKLFQGRLGSWLEVAKHPADDWYWTARRLPDEVGAGAIPALVAGGWQDDADLAGALTAYALLAVAEVHKQDHLMLGPWGRGGASADARFRAAQAAFFAFHLADRGPLELPRVQVWQTGAEKWEELVGWPPASVTTRSMYFRANHRLSFMPPDRDSSRDVDTWVADPSSPVPASPRPIAAGVGPRSADQRFSHQRPDVVSYQSATLDADLVVTGLVSAHLQASTTGSDADWVVKLIDVAPGGIQRLVSVGILRGRYRKGTDQPEAIPPNTVVPYDVTLDPVDHRFAKGHAVLVQVQSSWFPAIDRNPQRYIDPFTASEKDFQRATMKVARGKTTGSSITLPIRR